MHGQSTTTRTFRHAHLFCGIGAGARGFNMANPRVGNVQAHFECAGGIDVDAGAILNFGRLTGTDGTVMDLFSREQYVDFHGREPQAGWREATPADVRAALGDRLDVVFLSAPCKGFSGLLSSKQSITRKYQALNALTLRGVWLVCEAYKDQPIRIILFENVPRIMNRGRPLLDQISSILRSYAYNISESPHDCGKIAKGGLAQSRKRFLLIARQRELVPNFIYQPTTYKLRGVGEVIGKLPLPGDPVAGIMHRVPALFWKTWVRLAFVPAGKDWRALNDLAVENGVLRDYGIVPEWPGPAPSRVTLEGDPEMHGHGLGVSRWTDTGPTITSARALGQGRFSVADVRYGSRDRASTLGVASWMGSIGCIQGESYPTNGRFAIADPRPGDVDWNSDVLGVRSWEMTLGVVAARNGPTNGAFAVADVRPGYGPQTHRYVLGVLDWFETAGVLGASPKPTAGANCVADPRPTQGNQTYQQFGVRAWAAPAHTIKGDVSVGTGPYAVADIRIVGRPRFNNTFRIVRFDEAATAVAGPGGSAGGACVSDPRPADRDDGYKQIKYKVTRYDAAAGTVIGASTTGNGAFAVADPRGGKDPHKLHGKYRIEMWIGRASRAVIAGADNGAYAVADPRPVCLTAPDRDVYMTQGHYGVLGWGETSGAVPAFAKNNNGAWSVADVRNQFAADPIEEAPALRPVGQLPSPNEQLVCRIISEDETWHRPFTTLELAALQSIVDPEEVFYQDGSGAWRCRDLFDLTSSSDATKREWIGNAVPSASAAGIAHTIGETLLLAELGETFTLSSREIWVKPGALALSVDTDQVAFRWDLQ